MPATIAKIAIVSEKAFVANTDSVCVAVWVDNKDTNGYKAECRYIAQGDCRKTA